MSEQVIEWVDGGLLDLGGYEALVWQRRKQPPWRAVVDRPGGRVFGGSFATEAEARAAALKAIRRDAIDAAKLMGKVVAAVTAELGDSL